MESRSWKEIRVRRNGPQRGERMRGIIFTAAAVASGLLFCSVAAAAPDHASISGLTSVSVLSMINSTGDDAFSTMSLSPTDPSGTPTQHYGPYASGSPDSGTCGINDWAEDTFDQIGREHV